ncbi:helix-turn-helix domain-containing protein [Streptomyces sp. B8F3]|uniref:helix-turn-helix domain-containing protein n=1 Tax=unclassified Streptomyces TaxID=2593676 RepID=UPI00325C9A15
MKYQLASAGLTANDIASIWRIPKGTVYRYAHMHRWRRYKQIGRVYYHPADVTATLDEMQPE